MTFLRLPERHQASTDELEVITSRFPNVINSDDMSNLEDEFLDYQTATDEELPAYIDEDEKPIRIDLVWHKMSLLRDPSSGLPRFKHLAKLAKVFFSTIRKICTDGSITLERTLLRVILLLVYIKTQQQLEIT